MAHDHHDHGGGHAHASADFGAAFAIGVALNAAYIVVEAVYGIVGHSVALLADAGHNLGDVLGLGAAWLASELVKRRPTAARPAATRAARSGRAKPRGSGSATMRATVMRGSSEP